jgi:hypothetical protein
MTTQLQRLRIPPQWRGGLRIGRLRDTMTEYIATHPGYLEDLLRIDAELEAVGFVPMAMDRVKQPFDYDRRQTTSFLQPNRTGYEPAGTGPYPPP